MDDYTSKFLLINKLCFAERREIFAQFVALDSADKDNDPDIQRLVRHCKHRLSNVVKRFGEYGVEINARKCAEIIMRKENERWPNPLDGCKFYNGREIKEGGPNAMIANYEEAWVNFKRENREYLLNNLTEFISEGLMGMDNRTPMSFQAILWNRYCHWGYMSMPDEFEKWYFEYYYGVTH